VYFGTSVYFEIPKGKTFDKLSEEIFPTKFTNKLVGKFNPGLS
jgi:hypothetical protein